MKQVEEYLKSKRQEALNSLIYSTHNISEYHDRRAQVVVIDDLLKEMKKLGLLDK